MKPITFKICLSSDGVARGLELWQGQEHITVSFEAEGTHTNAYRWVEVRETVDAIMEQAREQVAAALLAATDG